MGFIHIDSQLGKIAQFQETLIDRQFLLVFDGFLPIESGNIVINRGRGNQLFLEWNRSGKAVVRLRESYFCA